MIRKSAQRLSEKITLKQYPQSTMTILPDLIALWWRAEHGTCHT